MSITEITASVLHDTTLNGFIATITEQPESLVGRPVICFDGDATPSNEFEELLFEFYWQFTFEWMKLGDEHDQLWWEFLYGQTCQLADLTDKDTRTVINAYEARAWQYRRSLDAEETKITDAQRNNGVTELVLLQARMIFEYAMVLKAVMKIKNNTRSSRLGEYVNDNQCANTLMLGIVSVVALPMASAINTWAQLSNRRELRS